ncbi:hypothetical protein [Streptomyces koyangensis]|uniref:hypothetical protein n=1 Tax=Streptomyces koyangensis TaxID=188770 RepID=UPI003C2E1CCB
MSSRWSDDLRACLPSFRESLLTGWLPDAFADAELLAALESGALLASPGEVAPMVARAPVHPLTVPVGARTRTVPLLPGPVHAALHTLTERALRDHRPHPSVHSAARTDWHYRRAYRARSEKLTELASGRDPSLVQHLDIENFGTSVGLGPLLAAPWMTAELASSLREVKRRTGQCLVHATSWSTRLGAALLDPLDQVVARHAGYAWARWSDGWHVAVRDAREGERLREALAGGLAAMGLRLSERKTVLLASSEVTGGVAADVSGPADEVWRAAVGTDDIRRYRYALLRAVPDPGITTALPDLVSRHPALLPRAVRYLDGATGSHGVSGTFAALWQWAAPETPEKEAPFRCGRLLALAARHEELARRVPQPLLDTCRRSPVTGLRELAERVTVSAHGPGAVAEPSSRVRDWVRRGAAVQDRPPRTTTYL